MLASSLVAGRAASLMPVNESNAYGTSQSYTACMAIDLRQMRHVLALAEHGTFARAAVALRLSQPALSRSIQTLEQQAGTTLFLRTTAGVVPTDVGRVVIQRARQVLHLAAELDHEVLSNRTLRSGHVSVGGGPFSVASTLSNALSRFITAYPQVSVRLQVRDWDELLRQLRARELDFFVAEISTLLQEHDLEIDAMEEHPLYFVARAGHPLAARGRITPVDTFSFPFVSPARIPPRLLEPMLAAKRTADPAAAARAFPSVECNSFSAVKSIVAGSDAITAATLSSMAAELERGSLALLGSEPWLTVNYGLVRLKGHPMSSASEKFRELVFDAERDVTAEEQRLLNSLQVTTAKARATRRRVQPQRRR
jgi:DNA-binding transcriptional LysR family regulator